MQAHGPLAAAVPQRDVEPAVEHQEELIGVVVNMPEVLAADMRNPDVVVVDPADDPRAVDVAEGGQCLAQADGGDCHAPIVAARRRPRRGTGCGYRGGYGRTGRGPGLVAERQRTAGTTADAVSKQRVELGR